MIYKLQGEIVYDKPFSSCRYMLLLLVSGKRYYCRNYSTGLILLDRFKLRYPDEDILYYRYDDMPIDLLFWL